MTKEFFLLNLSHYDNYILNNYIVNQCGINLNKLGKKITETIFKVDLDAEALIDLNLVKSKIWDLIKFVQNYYSAPNNKPLWHKINVVDQAINQYVGIGFLSLEKDWLQFILNYLDTDRATQSGDTIFTLFDRNFNWAISFTLLQENGILKIEKYEK